MEMALASWLIPLVVLFNLLLLPFHILILATALAALLSRRKSRETSQLRTRFLVVIPARDEEAGVAATVKSCLAVDYPEDLFEVVVIADNCSDSTALFACRAGATVVERHDPARQSKGFAIGYLIDRLERSGQIRHYDALVVIDADSTVSPDLLRGFADSIEAGNDWIQCFYTVSNPEASWRTRLMAYAFSLFNGVTPLGQFALGLSAGFRGNGMCFSTKGLRRVPWRSYGLVEDLEYSWNVRIAGEKVAFLPEARVDGVMLGQGGEAAIAQRQRWEYGRHEVRRQLLLPLMRSRRLSGIDKLTSVIELTMPPMVALMVYSGCVLAANLLLVLSSSMPAPVSLGLIGSCVIMSIALALHAIAPFLVFRLPWSYLLVILHLPAYAIWKSLIPLRGRPTQWIRTPREQPVNQ
jgi:cellulose synthase/poly-beta-1,6-N-acetylglucosamine synthase-like glycosyltransferase